MTLRDKETGEVTQRYTCDPRYIRELCFANMECLLQIALADSDEHIERLGGEKMLIDLAKDYEKLAEKMLKWERRHERERKRSNQT